MRPWLLAPVVVLCVLPPVSLAQSTGGASAPTGDGGVEYGTPGAAPKQPASKKPRARPRAKALTASEFSVDPGTLQPGGAPATFRYRLDGTARRARLRIEILPASGSARALLRLRLGWKPTGVARVHRWVLPQGALAPGDYQARLHAVDDAGNRLVRSASASGRSNMHVGAAPVPVTVGNGLFPIQGPFSWGGDDARFGAERGTHIHQGQDVMATEGTPLVSPRAGYVYWKAYQSRGAGHYLVIRGDDDRDYVFMHLQSGSPTVGRHDPVAAGQVIARVGSTGRSSAPHLHFEIWPDGWYAKGSKPIDPRPDLEAWAASSGTG